MDETAGLKLATSSGDAMMSGLDHVIPEDEPCPLLCEARQRHVFFDEIYDGSAHADIRNAALTHYIRIV